MSATLIGALAGGAGVIITIIWLVRRNRKIGRMDEQLETLSQHSESMGDINDSIRIQDEKDKGHIDSLRDADDFVDSLPDDPNDR